EEILDRDAKTWERLPRLRSDRSFAVLGESSLVVVPDEDQASITVSVDGDGAIYAASLDLALPIAVGGTGPLGAEFTDLVTAEAEAALGGEPTFGIRVEDFVVTPDEDGALSFDTAPGIPLRIIVFGGEERIAVEVDAPAAEYRDPDPFSVIRPGLERRNTLNRLDLFDSYGLSLEAGDVVTVEAESPGDLIVTVVSASGEQLVTFDDGGGEFGLDPTGTFTAEESDEYFVEVSTYDATAAYRIVVDVEPVSADSGGG
ncbi:MAG: PPC domain-containing protein, partial [Actinomycetota bacterium]